MYRKRLLAIFLINQNVMVAKLLKIFTGDQVLHWANNRTYVCLSPCKAPQLAMIVCRRTDAAAARRANLNAFTQSRLITDGCANACNYRDPLSVQCTKGQTKTYRTIIKDTIHTHIWNIIVGNSKFTMIQYKNDFVPTWICVSLA